MKNEELSEEVIKEAQSKFFAFYKAVGEGKTGWWLETLCLFLQFKVYASFIDKELKVATIEAPVQHGKSRVLRYFLCWLIGLHPNLRFNFYTASESLRDETKLEVDTILASPRYNQVFGARKKKTLKDNSETFLIFNPWGPRGKVNFRLMGAGNIGHPSHISLIDDPYRSKEDAYSKTIRDKVASRFRADIVTRRQQRSMVVVLHSRWHFDDLIGWIKNSIAPEDLINFSYPAIMADGSALFPELRSLAFLNKQKSILTPEEFNSLYQQSPMVEGGNKFKSEMFEITEVLPEEFDFTFSTSDTAYKSKQTNDFSVFSNWGVFKDDIYLTSILRERAEAVELEGRWKPILKQHSVWGYRKAWIEPKGHGIYLNQKFRNEKLLVPDEEELKAFFKDRTLDKVERANNALAFMANRKIKIYSKIACKDDLILEALAFPRGQHDDFVDTLIDAIKLSQELKADYGVTVNTRPYDIGAESRKRNW